MGSISRNFDITLSEILDDLSLKNPDIKLKKCELIFYVYWNESKVTWLTGGKQLTATFYGSSLKANLDKFL